MTSPAQTRSHSASSTSRSVRPPGRGEQLAVEATRRAGGGAPGSARGARRPAGRRRPGRPVGPQQLAARPVEHDPPVVAAEAPAPHPRDLAHRARARRGAAAGSRGRGPAGRRARGPTPGWAGRRAGPRPPRGARARPSPGAARRGARRRRRRDPLPGGEEPGERDRVDGLDLAPQLRERPAPEQAQDLGIAVLALGAAGPELAA